MVSQSIFAYLTAFGLGFFIGLCVVLPIKAIRHIRGLAATAAEIRGA